MMNAIWLALIVASVVAAAFNGKMPEVSTASVESAKAAVTLAIGLIGIMAFWLGMMRIVQEGGLLHSLARALRPVMTRLFPDVPPDHPAMSAMIMNIAANMLGLGNAATPFGIKAMIELNRLNPTPGVATDAMALFLAINTSNVALAPLGVIALRASVGSHNAAGIWLPTLIATSLLHAGGNRGGQAAAARRRAGHRLRAERDRGGRRARSTSPVPTSSAANGRPRPPAARWRCWRSAPSPSASPSTCAAAGRRRGSPPPCCAPRSPPGCCRC